MRRAIKSASLASCAVMLAGCLQSGDYEIKQIGNTTYLLDAATGETSVIEGDQILELEKKRLPLESKFSFDDTISESVAIEAFAKQVNDTVFYRFEFTSTDAQSGIEWLSYALDDTPRDVITLRFYDDDDFVLFFEDVRPQNNHSLIHNRQGEIDGIRVEGRFRVDPARFSQVEDMHYSFNMKSLDQAPN